MSLKPRRGDPILCTVKYTGLLIVLAGAALVLSFKLLKHSHRRPTLGALSESWLFEKRRHSDDQ